jgi:hypothetical protein
MNGLVSQLHPTCPGIDNAQMQLSAEDRELRTGTRTPPVTGRIDQEVENVGKIRWTKTKKDSPGDEPLIKGSGRSNFGKYKNFTGTAINLTPRKRTV